jgi:hypothetical protein
MAPASRKAQDLKAKEAKQKKILVAGAALLAILLFVQVPKLMHRSAAPAVAAPPATVTGPGATTPTAAAASLADTDVPPTAGDGQLVRFDLFETKDPFVQQVEDVAASTPADGATAGPQAAAPAKPAAVVPAPTETTGAFTTSAPPPVPQTSVARISIAGKVEKVVAHGEFPAAAPAFELVSFTTEKAEIAVAGGSFQSGDPTLTLLEGQTVTLENTADGSRYVLVYRGAAKVPTDSLPKPPAAG